MERKCICCNRSKDKLSRILYSKKECELQVIFYYILPTEMIRTIGEYLYQPELIKINHRIKRRNPLWLQYMNENRPPEFYAELNDIIMENKTTYNCSSCFLYNFINYKHINPNTMPRLRNDIHWFNNIVKKMEITSLYKYYYGDIFKFELPATYNMYFYRSLGLTIVKNNGVTIKEDIELQQTLRIQPILIENYNAKIFNNDEIKKIIIPYN